MAEKTGLALAVFEALKGSGGGGGGAVDDVQVNGVSVVSGGVANVPVATGTTLGVIKVSGSAANGIGRNVNNELIISKAEATDLKNGTDRFHPIVPTNQEAAAFYGLAKAAGADMASLASVTVGTYPEAQKSAISTMLNGSVSVTGSTPSITALPGIRYICGECATLDITLPASGCFDVVFESGSTPTVLTATGVTWPSWFDTSALEANTTYEISIADGFGAVMTWA